MTTLSYRPSSTSGSTNPSSGRINGCPAHFLTRPFSFSGNLSTLSARPRPLSACSTLSAVSIASSNSAASVTGERRRRSAALLDLEAELQQAGEGGGGGIRNSLLRAEEVLRASERERELERRRERAGFRTRQVRSAHLLERVWAAEDDDDATEDLSFPVPAPSAEAAVLPPTPISPKPASASPPRAPEEQPAPTRRSSLKRFSPKRFLRKARSIPVDILLSPSAAAAAQSTSRRWSNESSASETSPSSPAASRAEAVPSIPHAPPSRPSPLPRRAASSGDLLSAATAGAQSGLPRPASAAAGRGRYDTLPLPHLSTSSYAFLGPPENDLPSKFSASSGDSIVHLVSFGGGGGSASDAAAGAAGAKKGFKNRARTFSKASTDGLRNLSLRGRSAREKKVGKKPSLANLFSFGGGGGSGGEEKRASASGDSSAEKKKKAAGRAISFAASKIPTSSSSSAAPPSSSSTSGHRPSTSISSYAASTATSDSNPPPPSRKPSRLGFFRSTIRDSSTSGSSGGHGHNPRGSIRARTISRPLSVATSADGACSSPVPFDHRRFSEATGSSASGGEASAPASSDASEKKRGWASKIRGAVTGRGRGNVAAKRALFEGKKENASSGGEATVLVGEKVTVKNSRSPQLTSRLPSRIPLATVFPHAHSASSGSDSQPPARPPRPPSDLHSSDDTTFYGHRIPAVKSRAAAIDALSAVKSSAPRVRPKTSIPVARARLAPIGASAQPALPVPQTRMLTSPPSSHGQQQQHAATFGFATATAQPARPPIGMLFPPPAQPVYPTRSLPNRRWTPDSFDASSSGSPTSSSSGNGFTTDSFSPSHAHAQRPASPFRSPSPARFRDLLPSATAQSSPERNERGLPMPFEASPVSERGERRGESPKKRAMGPEQVIVMEDQKQPTGPISEVRYATTDLADILSNLDDTQDIDTSGLNTSRRSGTNHSHASTSTASTSFATAAAPARPHLQQDVSDLSASLRCHLPHLDSIESLRSTVSDVPPDLKELIDTVDDHISLHSFEGLSPAVFIEGQSMGARGFADEYRGDNGELLSDSSSGTSTDDEDEEEILASGNEAGGGTAFGAIGMGAFLSVGGDHTTGAFSSDGGGGATATLEYEATATSFIGGFSTAGEVLRSVLAAGQAPALLAQEEEGLQGVPEGEEESEEEDPRAMLRESVRDALELGRPSHGDKMFERDDDVHLSALLGSPSPPLSPEQQASQTAFFRNHLRNGSAFSSTEGSLESYFSMSGSPTPYPRSGRPLRQSLARYSQDNFPTKRPSHRARPISEQSNASSSEHDHLPPPTDLTSLSLAQSSRSTNLSISSITSSPCPVPRHRRIPMLTRIPPPPLQPSFRFPPEKPSSATVTFTALGSPFELRSNPMEQYGMSRSGGESSAEETGNIPSATIKTSTSPRFVRPLRPSQAGEPLPRPRLLELQQLEDNLIPPDTPPPSSPSVSDGERGSLFVSDSRQSSLDFERPLPPASSSRRSKNAGHSRQASRSSGVIKSTIVEEAEDPNSPTNATVELAIRLHLQPLSPIAEPVSPSPQRVPVSPYSDPPSVSILLSPVDEFETGRKVVELDGDEASDSDGDFELTAETAPETTRAYVYLRYESDMELKRSQATWPDTDASREAVALFNAPRTYHAILEFLFYSQNRWPSPPHLIRFNSFVPPAFDDPPTPPSPIRIPSPIVDSSFETTGLVFSQPPSPPPAKPAPPTRRVLAPKAANKQVVALSRSTSSPSKAPKEDHSPFTALPPRLGSKLRAVRAKMASKSPKKAAVDTSFLGAKVSSRRQEQLEAAMRRLEGTGRPSEQRSDSESDFTGVFEAAGEATDEFTFSKTPRLSSQRPKVRRKTALSTLR
ncbi:hypothetical protein JCM6882_001682 [Rhodosporidiobolus microsporus]